MRILFCCQFYAPSVGGVQEVVRQIAERLAARGHHVTVATGQLSTRTFDTLNGVYVNEFAVTGNAVKGMTGEIDRYRDFVIKGDFDLVMIKAAQQWTFDALWPILDKISMLKVFIPCGFSSLYEPTYEAYYRQIPDILRKFDHLIFYASSYRDIDMARAHSLDHFSILPNGASELEFNVSEDPSFRKRQGIPERSLLVLTVGSFTGLKGHLELAKAFALLKLDNDAHATLILNGNACPLWEGSLGGFWIKFTGSLKVNGFQSTFGKILKKTMNAMQISVSRKTNPWDIARMINRTQPNKRVLITDFPRRELIQAFMASDLFVFASNVEYSPLVLFESSAAGTPFLTVPVGNSEEIAKWTEAGVICPATRDPKGYTRVDPVELARSISQLLEDKALRKRLGEAGRRNWQEKFTWEKISREYETLFLRLVEGKAANS